MANQLKTRIGRSFGPERRDLRMTLVPGAGITDQVTLSGAKGLIFGDLKVTRDNKSAPLRRHTNFAA